MLCMEEMGPSRVIVQGNNLNSPGICELLDVAAENVDTLMAAPVVEAGPTAFSLRNDNPQVPRPQLFTQPSGNAVLTRICLTC
jgi:hypothetical protein